MARYIPLDVVVAEIERLQDAIKTTAIDDRISKEQAEAYKVCVKLRSFVEDTLEAKEVQEEPVSKDLEKATVEAFKHIVDSDKNSFLEIFKAGAKWKEELYKKNLLDVCKKQTEEEAEIERDFIEGIIDEHRLPTFDDAIKYGMRLQKEQFEKEHTKNCGNVEYEQDVYPPACQPWFTPDQAKKAVEIAREEIYKWLANHYRDYMHNPTGEKLEAFFGMDMITDLKQAMKDE